MRRRYLILIILLAAVLSGVVSEAGEEKVLAGVNRFSDPVFREIADLQNRRDGVALLVFLKHTDPRYRVAALTACASVQDPATVQGVADCLKDRVAAVRGAAALALGRMGIDKGEPFLIAALRGESDSAVRREMLEALGRCGGPEGARIIVDFAVGKDVELLTGQALGLCRLAQRKIAVVGGLEKAVALCAPEAPERARLYASYALLRSGGADLRPFSGALTAAFRGAKDSWSRINLAGVMGKAATPEAWSLLKSILEDKSGDYRIRVNGVRALAGFKTPEARQLLISLAVDPHAAVAVAAAEFILGSGQKEEAVRYWEVLGGVVPARARATLCAAMLRWGDPGDVGFREKVMTLVKEELRKSPGGYDKAHWLGALAYEPSALDDIAALTFANVGNVIGTSGLEALFVIGVRDAAGPGGWSRWLAIAQKAIETGDSAMIALAAGFLRTPELKFPQLAGDTAFLKTALEKCGLPGDAETRLELLKTLAFFQGQPEPVAGAPVKPAPINWDAVAAIPAGQQVRMRTSRGEAVIRLFVDDAPGSVENFVTLIRSGFYHNRHFHRMVPNFVVQDGCPRGDGWGSSSRIIASELAPLYYEEGSVGMASSGKDTESSQWFITHSPTPHLDGSYSLFGKVVSGMEMVHQLEAGDRILTMELLNR